MTVDKIKCEMCDEEFEPKKYSKTITCSKVCQLKLGVRTRKNNDSYDHDPFSKEKIRAGVNKANASLLQDNVPIGKYRNAAAAKLEYDAAGILVSKECTICKQILSLEQFRKSRSVKCSKTGYVSTCRPCEIISKTGSRRMHGVKPMFNPMYTLDELGNLLEKECSRCRTMKPAGVYANSKLGRFNKQSSCATCQADYSAIRKYGVNYKLRTETYNEQNGCCAICKTPKKINELAIDHDHSAEHGKGFRGLLCNGCNFAYGVLGDGNDKTPDILRGMLDYYNKTKS